MLTEALAEHPSLGWLIGDWVAQHCVIPDGFHASEPFVFTDEQLAFVVNHYRVRPDAELGQLASAFHFRRSQIVRPQKWGKNPLVAAMVCVEGVGPALFAGWAAGGESWDCAEHGCGCGWVYVFEPGEPMAMAWPTPLIQITAVSEDQTDNTYDALRPMIDNGPLHELIPKTGEEFIRLPGGGRVDVVTSNARSRLGQRVTFVPQDETGLWTQATGMVKVAETQRRGLAGMGGRAVETTNAWDPAEDSVAKRTFESKAADVYRDYQPPPAHLSYANKRERRKIHEFNYRGSWWVQLDGIEAEAAELMELDVAQAERFFGNRVRPASEAAFNSAAWARNTDATVVIPDRSLIVVGVDGARYEDALALVATDVESGHQWPLDIQERPTDADDGYEHDFDHADGVMLDAFERFEVWRVYIDPGSHSGNISPLVDRWLGRWGDKRIIEWFMHRQRQVGVAMRNYATAISGGDFTNDGESRMAGHVSNARRQMLNAKDDQGKRLWTICKPSPGEKVDASAAGCLSWEARGDAIAAGATVPRKAMVGGF